MMLVCLTATAGYAQQVLVENGKIVIDASAIPNTQVKKARTTDGTNTKRGTNDATNISSVVSVKAQGKPKSFNGFKWMSQWRDYSGNIHTGRKRQNYSYTYNIKTD